MKALIGFIICTGLLLTPVWADYKTSHVVLVSSAKQPLPKFTHKELRLLYLGYSISNKKKNFEPLINATHKSIYRGFLQKIMYMSEKNYERQLVARIFRQGGERPEKFSTLSELIDNLKKNPNKITFINLDFAKQVDDIQVVQRLW